MPRPRRGPSALSVSTVLTDSGVVRNDIRSSFGTSTTAKMGAPA